MNFKLVSKTNMGVVTMLLLVILLSQSRFFNFLVDTPLGRALLISLLLVISYTNKILGVVTVLIIIIMFNNSDIGYLEGFTDTSNTDKKPSDNKLPIVSSKVNSNESLDTTTKPALNKLTTTSPSTKKLVEKPETNKPVEGFDIIGKERNIQKGKQSNSIPVTDFMRESTSVSPYEGGSFSEEFSLY
uniref:Uncharacterized protein n=1 Tax=viral metagenome TaxID=1070528 RepID=A0A6C0EQP7_9ZZZZ